MSSREVDNAIGAATPGSKQVLAEKQKALEDARGRYVLAKEMRDEEEMGVESGIIAALREIISSIETELVGTREREGVRAAEARLVGIRRAFGSVTSSINADEQRVGEKIAEVEEAITRLNDRYSQSVQLRAEAAALADRFNIPKVALPDVAPPARRDVAVKLTTLPNTLRATAWGNEPTEECEFKMRVRRTYVEAAGTPGAEIIEGAGLKPWPELTERQKEIIAARERDQEQTRRQFAGLPKIPQGGSVPLGSL